MNRVNGTEFSLTGLLGLISEPDVKESWQMVVSATLWIIWLFRNAYVFNKVKTCKEGVLSVLRARITKWLESTGILCGEYVNLFWVNPWGTARVVFKHKYEEFWEGIMSRYDWVVTVDGAVHKSNNMHVKAGIGGVIRSSRGKPEFIFSGPSGAINAFDAELDACLHILRILEGNFEEGTSIVICSDSMEMVAY
uniref:Uncharacterized protein n=1 Tax=Daucus carota subsp. sativus TaxID=79200 RepID=A0A162A040_DAUCS